MSRRLRFGGQVVAVATVAALLGLLVWKVTRDESEIRDAVDAGKVVPAPAFSLPRLDREGTISLESLRGKAVVLNFWASWCGPCKDEAPVLEATWRKYRGQGLVVLGIDYDDVKGDARAFMRKTGLTYPVAHDRDKKLVSKFRVTGVPETFFIDRRGRLVGGSIAGAVNASDEDRRRFERNVRRALA